MVSCGMFAKILAMLAVLAALAGCTSLSAPAVLKTSFDPQAASFINAEGRAKVSGQAFVRRNNGRLLRATGTDVFLIPRTPYSDERIGLIYGSGKQPQWGANLPPAAPLFEGYMRKTVASSGGSFSFDRVADGGYYVVAMIHLPSDYAFRQFPIVERVDVEDGRSVRVVMRGY